MGSFNIAVVSHAKLAELAVCVALVFNPFVHSSSPFVATNRTATSTINQNSAHDASAAVIATLFRECNRNRNESGPL
jgi:hypothetical protein